MRRPAIALCFSLAVLLAACAQASPKASTSAAARTTAKAQSAGPTASSTAPKLLFAVLETRHCTAPEPAACEGLVGIHDTAAIAGIDGFAKARTTFTARKVPPVGNAATLLDLEAQVANGGMYFVDGSGVIRRLSAGGAVTTIATFAIDSGYQSVSFAVRPDGKQVLAAVLTYPKQQASSDPNQPFGSFSGPWRLQIEEANAGGPSTIIRQWSADTTQYPNGPSGFANIWLVGWDAKGPITLVGQNTGTQNAWLNNQRYFAGHISRLGADGTPGPAIGPANCLPYWRPTGGVFACTILGQSQNETVDVVDLSGNVIWSGGAPAGLGQIAGDFAFSSDGTSVAMDTQTVDLRTKAVVHIDSGFQPRGWLDSKTLIGLIPVNGPAAAHVGVLRLDNPQHPEDWGFSGAYVGLLS